MVDERKQGGGEPNLIPEEDPNWLAYKAQETELKVHHMGKWVAFYNGELAMIEDDLDILQTRMYDEKGITGFMFHHIVEEESVIHIRNPR